jgi:hypothetical protein
LCCQTDERSRLFFVLSTLLSLYAVFYYKREGYLPGASRAPMNASMIDPDKDAFSTAPHDDEYVAVHNTDDHEIHDLPTHQGGYDAPTYGGNNTPPTYGGTPAPYSGAYQPPTVEDSGYTGYQGGFQAEAGRQSPQVGSDGRVHFPNARYAEV